MCIWHIIYSEYIAFKIIMWHLPLFASEAVAVVVAVVVIVDVVGIVVVVGAAVGVVAAYQVQD